MPLTPGCLPPCPVPPPVPCPVPPPCPAVGSRPDFLSGRSVGMFDTSALGLGSVVRCVMGLLGNKAQFINTNGFVHTAVGTGGLVQNLVLGAAKNLSFTFPEIGLVSVHAASSSVDGHRLYTVGGLTGTPGPANQFVTQWNMTTAFDPFSIASVNIFNMGALGGGTAIYSVDVRDDKMLIGYHTTFLYEMVLGDPLDVSTAVLSSTLALPANLSRDAAYSSTFRNIVRTDWGATTAHSTVIQRLYLPTPGNLVGAQAAIPVNFENILVSGPFSTMSFLEPSQDQAYFMRDGSTLEQISLTE